MECSACRSNIDGSEEYICCSLIKCRKRYHSTCIGATGLSSEGRNNWICLECCCIAKKGGDNSSTPVGISKKIKDPFVATRQKPSANHNDNATSEAALLQEMSKMRNELSSMRGQFSEEIACYVLRYLGCTIL